MIVTIKNNFHNTEANIRVPALPYQLSDRQVYRASRKLCGISDCYCGTIRGPQDYDVEWRGVDGWVVSAKEQS